MANFDLFESWLHFWALMLFNSSYLKLCYFLAMQGSFVILVCSDASTLLVYKDSSLQWNCKLPFAPLVIQVAKFQVNRTNWKVYIRSISLQTGIEFNWANVVPLYSYSFIDWIRLVLNSRLKDFWWSSRQVGTLIFRTWAPKWFSTDFRCPIVVWIGSIA